MYFKDPRHPHHHVTHAKISTHANFMDPRHPRQNFDPRHPRHFFDPLLFLDIRLAKKEKVKKENTVWTLKVVSKVVIEYD